MSEGVSERGGGGADGAGGGDSDCAGAGIDVLRSVGSDALSRHIIYGGGICGGGISGGIISGEGVADRAVDAMPPSAASTFSAFERLFNALWANGRGATSNAAPLCACLDSLPEDEGSFVKFVGDAMTDELIGAIVLAAEAVMLPEHTERAAALVCRLVAIRRFDVLWMMQGKRETAAVEAVLGAARKKSTDSKPLDAAAKRFGVQLQ